MKKKKIKTKIIKNTIDLWSFSSIAGIASALFFIVLARFLSVESYSLLYALVAFSFFLTIPQETIRTVISRLMAKLFVKKEKGKMKYIFSKFSKRIFIFAIALTIIYIALIPVLEGLFKTTFWPIFIIGIAIIFSFMLAVTRGTLQGILKFKPLGINNSVEHVSKLGIALLLILLLPEHLKLIGALISIPASLLISYLIGFIPLKNILKSKKKNYNEGKIFKYFVASFTIFLIIGVIYSLDIILARYFFSENLSGLYAGIAMIGKSLFFIGLYAKRVMFPSIVKEEKNPKKTKKLLIKTGFLLLLLFSFFFVISAIFPNFLIMIFLGSKYLSVAPLLKYIVLAFAFFSLSTLLIFYNLSLDINKKISIKLLLSATFMQFALLLIFHSSLLQFISMLIIVNALMFVFLLIINLRKQE